MRGGREDLGLGSVVTGMSMVSSSPNLIMFAVLHLPLYSIKFYDVYSYNRVAITHDMPSY